MGDVAFKKEGFNDNISAVVWGNTQCIYGVTIMILTIKDNYSSKWRPNPKACPQCIQM